MYVRGPSLILPQREVPPWKSPDFLPAPASTGGVGYAMADIIAFFFSSGVILVQPNIVPEQESQVFLSSWNLSSGLGVDRFPGIYWFHLQLRNEAPVGVGR